MYRAARKGQQVDGHAQPLNLRGARPRWIFFSGSAESVEQHQHDFPGSCS